MLYVKFGENRLHGFREDVVRKCWRTDEGQWMPAYTLSSPMSLQLSWAKKVKRNMNCDYLTTHNLVYKLYTFDWLSLINSHLQICRTEVIIIRSKRITNMPITQAFWINLHTVYKCACAGHFSMLNNLLSSVYALTVHLVFTHHEHK